MTPSKLASGAVMQGGISPMNDNAGGLLLRGVVTATYVVDDPNHPFSNIQDNGPTAIYCDVLTYSGMRGRRWQFFKNVLVRQDRGGMQNGHVWKPRATTLDVTGNTLNVNMATNPADMDGDHVLVGFIDQNFNQPVILGGVPHPSVDIGYDSSQPAGVRQRLVLADGDPDFWKHHGAYYGITDTGDFRVDTTFANDGSVNSDGSEPPPSTDGSKGNHLYFLEQHCKRLLSLMDMSSPDSPQAVLTETLTMARYLLDFLNLTPVWQLLNANGNSLQVQDVGDNATLILGTGAQHAAVAENLADWWNNTIVPKLDTFDAHVHSTGTGPSGPPTPTIGAPNVPSNVTSQNVAIPTQS